MKYSSAIKNNKNTEMNIRCFMLNERIQSPKVMGYLILIRTKKIVKENKSVVARVWSKRRVVQRDGRREAFGKMTLFCIQIVVVVT